MAVKTCGGNCLPAFTLPQRRHATGAKRHGRRLYTGRCCPEVAGVRRRQGTLARPGGGLGRPARPDARARVVHQMLDQVIECQLWAHVGRKSGRPVFGPPVQSPTSDP